MQLYFKNFLYLYAFVLLSKFSFELSIRVNKYLFISSYHLPGSKFFLEADPSLMPNPSRESKSETSKSPKVEQQRLRETIRKIKAESEKKTESSTKEEREKEVNSWRVILYNDDIHNFNYVTESIAKCVPQLPLPRAHLITLEAHKNGQAEILRTWKEKAEQYCRELQKFGLTVCTINDLTKN